jgi:hypothetical protein
VRRGWRQSNQWEHCPVGSGTSRSEPSDRQTIERLEPTCPRSIRSFGVTRASSSNRRTILRRGFAPTDCCPGILALCPRSLFDRQELGHGSSLLQCHWISSKDFVKIRLKPMRFGFISLSQRNQSKVERPSDAPVIDSSCTVPSQARSQGIQSGR